MNSASTPTNSTTSSARQPGDRRGAAAVVPARGRPRRPARGRRDVGRTPTATTPLRDLLLHQGGRRRRDLAADGRGPPRRRTDRSPSIIPEFGDQRQGRHHRRAGAAAHVGLPACAARPARVARPRAPARAVRPVAAQLGAGHPVRVPPDVGPLGAGRAARARRRHRLPRVHQRARARAARSARPRARCARGRAGRHRRRSSHVGEPPTPEEFEAVLGVPGIDVGEVTEEALLGFNRARRARASACPAAAACRPRPTSRSSTKRCCTTRAGCGTRSGWRSRTSDVRNTFPDPMPGVAANRTIGLVRRRRRRPRPLRRGFGHGNSAGDVRPRRRRRSAGVGRSRRPGSRSPTSPTGSTGT